MAEPRETNVDPNLWAEAIRVYTEDKGAEDRARGQTKRHQLHYEAMGIDPTTIRERFKEANMTADERQAKFSRELTSRKALSLWDAESPEDFNRIMERAMATEVASTEKLGSIDGARAYNDGYNSGMHGGKTADDNLHTPGTIMHAQWARGVADGLRAKERGAAISPVPHPSEPVSEAPAPGYRDPEIQPLKPAKRKRGATAAPDPAEPEPPPADSLFGDGPIEILH